MNSISNIVAKKLTLLDSQRSTEFCKSEKPHEESLQGLDNIAAAGAEGFDTMNKMVDQLKDSGASVKCCEEIRDNLKDGKRYLKTDYRVHCQENGSSCLDHCTC